MNSNTETLIIHQFCKKGFIPSLSVCVCVCVCVCVSQPLTNTNPQLLMVSVNKLASLAESLINQHDMTHCLLMNNLFFTK